MPPRFEIMSFSDLINCPTCVSSVSEYEIHFFSKGAQSKFVGKLAHGIMI